mgnify:CR=1 FL=1
MTPNALCVIIDEDNAPYFNRTYRFADESFNDIIVISNQREGTPPCERRMLCKDCGHWDTLMDVLEGMPAEYVWVLQPPVLIPDLKHHNMNKEDLLCQNVVRDKTWHNWKFLRSVYGGRSRGYPRHASRYSPIDVSCFRLSKRLSEALVLHYKRSNVACKELFFWAVAQNHRCASVGTLRTLCWFKKDVDVVISCYKTQITWLRAFVKLLGTENINCVYIYSKGNNYAECDVVKNARRVVNIEYEQLENIGRCDHTYLHHIVKNWNAMAGYTYFVKDTMFCGELLARNGKRIKRDHSTKMMEHVRKRAYLKGTSCYSGIATVRRNFRLQHYQSVKYRDTYYTSSYGHFGDYCEYLGIEIGDAMKVQLGGVFGVSEEKIKRQKREMYEKIKGTLNRNNCEEGHYVERLWMMLFEEEFHLTSLK